MYLAHLTVGFLTQGARDEGSEKGMLNALNL